MSVPLPHGSGGFSSAAFARDNNGSTRSSSSNGSLDDEFSKLKSEREKQRIDKAMQKLSRSVSNRATGERSSVDMNDTEILLSELASTSRQSHLPLSSDEREHCPPDST